MVKDCRITYRRSTPYNTKSNRIRPVKTPGGRFVARTIVKSSKGVSCPATGNKIHGVSRTRPADFRRLPKCKRTVSRAYGGHLSHQAVKDKIMRAFIVEEQKVLKQVLVEKTRTKKAAAKGGKRR